MTKSVLSLVALAAVCGCGDDSLQDSVSAVNPNRVFLGRTVDVLVSGSNTNWREDAVVDFGDGIAVDQVVVASPTALLVTISVSPDAQTGLRDVIVDGRTFGGFIVESQVEITNTRGSTSQGSIFLLDLRNRDLTHPFDDAAGDENPTNFAATLGEGTTVTVRSVSAFSATLEVLVDVNASAGQRDLNILSGPPGSPDVIGLPAALSLNTRTAITLAEDVTENGNFVTPYESVLFSLTPATPTLYDVGVTTNNNSARPVIHALARDGSFEDFIVQGRNVEFSAVDSTYLLLFDGSGVSGHAYSITADATAADGGPESEPNNDDIAAEVASLPFVVSGEISAETDEDWFTFDVGAPDEDKRLEVMTQPGHGLADTMIYVYDSTFNFTSPNQCIPGETTGCIEKAEDLGFHERLVTPGLAQGTYYVRVTWSEFFPYNSNAPEYVGTLRLIAPSIP